MQIGCFALIEPFSDLRRQFEAIAEMGFAYADLTDNHDGAALGAEFGFAATASLDAPPDGIGNLATAAGLTLTAVCAHANLLDPTGPHIYGTAQVIKAIRLARDLGIGQVITTEGEPKTEFGRTLTPEQRIFSIVEKLYFPVRWAAALGIELLLEPHGIVTDDLDAMAEVLDRLDAPRTVGLNLDTGNLWLGGGEPLAFIERFGQRIRHVHWKDLGPDWIDRRGQLHGCGMGTIPLGDGVVGLKDITQALRGIGFDGPTTLEVAGREAVLASARRLREWMV